MREGGNKNVTNTQPKSLGRAVSFIEIKRHVVNKIWRENGLKFRDDNENQSQNTYLERDQTVRNGICIAEMNFGSFTKKPKYSTYLFIYFFHPFI